jgi:hypothetical protein
MGLPRSHVGGNRRTKRSLYLSTPRRKLCLTKTKYVTKSGKSVRCEVWDETTKQWSTGRPEKVLLFNLAAIAGVLASS